jgi:hypothetical protein
MNRIPDQGQVFDSLPRPSPARGEGGGSFICRGQKGFRERTWRRDLRPGVPKRTWRRDLRLGVAKRTWRRELRPGVPERTWRRELRPGVPDRTWRRPGWAELPKRTWRRPGWAEFPERTQERGRGIHRIPREYKGLGRRTGPGGRGVRGGFAGGEGRLWDCESRCGRGRE